ncbi:MAG: hypothetical protein LBS74_08200 [Oscillospiraceae bacterium]|nr:hypothetical protein [Oscillospiraceae bacterium]
METSNSKRIDKDIDYLKKFRVKNKTIKRAFIITGVALGVLLLIIGSYIGVLSIGFAPSSKDFAYTANYKDGNYGISLDYNNRAVVGARSVRIFQNEKKENVVEVQIKTVPDWLVPDFFGRVTKFDWGFDENAFYEYPDTAELQSNCDDFTVIIICSDKNIVIPKEEFLAQKQE